MATFEIRSDASLFRYARFFVVPFGTGIIADYGFLVFERATGTRPWTGYAAAAMTCDLLANAISYKAVLAQTFDASLASVAGPVAANPLINREGNDFSLNAIEIETPSFGDNLRNRVREEPSPFSQRDEPVKLTPVLAEAHELLIVVAAPGAGRSSSTATSGVFPRRGVSPIPRDWGRHAAAGDDLEFESGLDDVTIAVLSADADVLKDAVQYHANVVSNPPKGGLVKLRTVDCCGVGSSNRLVRVTIACRGQTRSQDFDEPTASGRRTPPGEVVANTEA